MIINIGESGDMLRPAFEMAVHQMDDYGVIGDKC